VKSGHKAPAWFLVFVHERNNGKGTVLLEDQMLMTSSAFQRPGAHRSVTRGHCLCDARRVVTF